VIRKDPVFRSEHPRQSALSRHSRAAMSKPPLLQGSQSSPRPTSTGSYFTDSAINMDISTPPLLKSLPPLDALYSTSSGLFERLNQIAAAAWDAERDGRLTKSNVENLHKQLDGVESRIAGEDSDAISDQHTPREGRKEQPISNETLSNDAHLESLSSTVLTDLRSTVSSLRLRHTEHRHLLSLTTSRLETLAQRCIAQERAIESLTAELRSLRTENNVLGKENEDASTEIEALKAENASKDLAMEAMAGAVSGLEGWIENTVPEMAVKSGGERRAKRKEVIRGRGRFRGRYYVDEYEPGRHEVETDVRDLHDGVKAWLRGFRDVEEGLRVRGGIGRGRTGDLRNGKLRGEVVDDEWGDFESAA
jgi:hypothetical protein